MSLLINPFVFATPAGSSLLDGLVAYWKLDEASGTRNDSVGSNHLTDNNTVTQAVGKIGNAAQFTATNLESLSIADNADLSTGDIDFGFATWVYLDSKGTSRYIATKGEGNGTNDEFLFGYSSGADRFFLGVYNGVGGAGEALANALGSPSLATYYLIKAWHDSVANTVNIQVNNGTVDSVSYSGGGQDTTNPFTLGGTSAFGASWDGRIDEFGFWKRVWTFDERATLWNGGVGLTHPF